MFQSFKQISKTVTKDQLPSMGLKGRIISKLKKWKSEGRLSLISTKEKALIEFLASYSNIISRATLSEVIATGFHDNSMIDTKTCAIQIMT